jgi:hypothetical protein
LEQWFDQLGAAENSDRTYAGAAIAQLHERDGQEKAIIDRLFGMLTLKEVCHFPLPFLGAFCLYGTLDHVLCFAAFV